MESTSPILTKIQDNLLLVSSTVNMGELDYVKLAPHFEKTIQLFSDHDLKSVVMDLTRTNYLGSSTIEWFVRFWKRVSARNGTLVFCGISPNEREILKATQLEKLWTIYDTLEEAISGAQNYEPDAESTAG